MNDEPLYINDPDALVTAAYEGEYGLVCSLINNGANPDVTNEYGETALMVASENGYDAIIEYLLDHGADINIKNKDGDTALDIAKYNNCRNTFALLLSHGAVGSVGPSAKERMMDAFYEDCERANSIKMADSKSKDEKSPNKAKSPDAKKPRG
ncbi:MAG: hypothetical protein GWP06_02690 [Actinobacteria bacterium]|nr:hypothetical protein [Actinomycetota bacterium]